jgi:transposase-like protein/uncharacterized phage-like protein YoqJ
VLYLCHEEKKRKCPICGSLKSKKNGKVRGKWKTARGMETHETQRFLCKGCGKSFTVHGHNARQRTSPAFKAECVHDYMLGGMSTQSLSDSKDIGKTSVLNWLPEIAAKNPFVSLVKNPNIKWSGIIVFDGKEVKHQGKKLHILIAADDETGIPFCYGLYDRENKASSEHFLQKVKESYPIDIIGIKSDFGRSKSFINTVKNIFLGVPHQTCQVHYLRHLRMRLPTSKNSKYWWRNKILLKIIKKILQAPTREISLKWLAILNSYKRVFQNKKQIAVIKSINKNYEHLTTYYENRFLTTNTNVIENIIRQLNRRLKTMDGVKSIDNLLYFLQIKLSDFIIKKGKTATVK